MIIKRVLGLLLPLVMITPAHAQSGPIDGALCNGIVGRGHAATPADMQFMDIGARIREHIAPIDEIGEAAQTESAQTRVLGIEAIKYEHQNMQKLREQLAGRICSCSLTVKPDGSIANLRILNTSGSDKVDQRALDLITRAAPFKKSTLTDDQHYVIEFPLLTVKPAKQ